MRSRNDIRLIDTMLLMNRTCLEVSCRLKVVCLCGVRDVTQTCWGPTRTCTGAFLIHSSLASPSSLPRQRDCSGIRKAGERLPRSLCGFLKQRYTRHRWRFFYVNSISFRKVVIANREKKKVSFCNSHCTHDIRRNILRNRIIRRITCHRCY